MSSISFNETPNNVRIPIFMVEFDNSNAIKGAQFQPYNALILGQKLPAGLAEPLKPVKVVDKDDGIRKFGAGSMLAEMADYYRRVDKTTDLWAIAVPDESAGVKAASEVTVIGVANEPGAIFCYINGVRFTVTVKAADTPALMHAAFTDAVNALADLPVKAHISADKVTLEAKQPGEAGNDIDIRFNYNDGEYFPSGIAVAATPFTGGVANPDLTDAVATVKGEWFNALACPYTDINNLYILNEYLKECWGPMVMKEGWAFGARRGTFGQLCDFGGKRNSHVETFMNCSGIPNSPWAVAASVAANVMRYGNMDPARPFQTLPLVGILPPKLEDRFSDFPENNQLLYDGISTFTTPVGGTVNIGRLITTYKLTANGASDTSYLDINTGLTLGYLRWDLRSYFMRKYPRHKLADDGIRYSSGHAIMTPKLAKAECINKFDDWAKMGLVENAKQFKDELIVERNESDRNRLDFYLPPDLVNQFRVGAVKASFIL